MAGATGAEKPRRVGAVDRGVQGLTPGRCGWGERWGERENVGVGVGEGLL